MGRCLAVNLGMTGYRGARRLQKELHSLVAVGELPNLLLLLEHPHVYTLGRRGNPSHILLPAGELARKSVDVHHVDRGGEVTYHGPGQLVAYPIIDLRQWGRGPLKYVRALEQVIVDTLAEHGIKAESSPRPTGVWVGDAKIAAIGVKVSRGVTTHGLALNVDPDLSYFEGIVPCGMPHVQVTSMSALNGEAIAVDAVASSLARHFGRIFGWTVDWTTRKELNWHRQQGRTQMATPL